MKIVIDIQKNGTLINAVSEQGDTEPIIRMGSFTLMAVEEITETIMGFEGIKFNEHRVVIDRLKEEQNENANSQN